MLSRERERRRRQYTARDEKGGDGRGGRGGGGSGGDCEGNHTTFMENSGSSDVLWKASWHSSERRRELINIPRASTRPDAASFSLEINKPADIIQPRD